MTYIKKYTCNEYREEMILLSLNNRLNDEKTTEDEIKQIKKEINELEIAMGLD